MEVAWDLDGEGERGWVLLPLWFFSLDICI